MVSHLPIKGLHFKFDGSNITFFATKGRVVDADTWAISNPSGTRFTDVVPMGASSFIAGSISLGTINGHADKIASVLLSPRMAVSLWLEGVALTRDHLENARENFAYVDLLNIDIRGYTVDIRILSDLRGNIVIADSHFRPI